MVTWLYWSGFPNVLQWTYIIFLIRKKSSNCEIQGKLYSVVCPEALSSPSNGPADHDNMLGRIFLVMMRMFQEGRGRAGRRAAGRPKGKVSPTDR